MKRIKQYFIRRNIKRRQNLSSSFATDQSLICILYDQTTENLISDLKNQLKKKFQCELEDIKSIGTSEKSNDEQVLSYNAFNLKGDIKSDFFDKNLLRSCEILIVYTKKTNLLLEYLQSIIDKKLQVGLSQNHRIKNDISIDIEAEKISLFTNELLDYQSKIILSDEKV